MPDALVQARSGQPAARWDVEVLFADTKDLLGVDQNQLVTSTAIVRFWTLVLATPTLLPAIIYLVAMIQAPFLLTLWYSFHGFSLLQVKVQML
jgi:hypothetical protein